MGLVVTDGLKYDYKIIFKILTCLGSYQVFTKGSEYWWGGRGDDDKGGNDISNMSQNTPVESVYYWDFKFPFYTWSKCGSWQWGNLFRLCN